MVQTPKIDTDKVKDSAAEVAAALVGAGSRAADGARDAAGQAREWAGPRYDAFVEWLRPRAEKAWNDSIQAAAPRVEAAATKAGPLVDTAHDKIVDDYLPKLVVAFNAAAERAGATAEELAKAARKAAKEAEKAAKKEQRKGRRRKAFVWTVVLGATAAAGYAFYRRAQPQNDPWAEPWEQSTAPDFDGAARDARHVAGDAAEAVGAAAGAAVAKGREAGEKISEKAAEVRDDVAARTTRARKKTEDAATEAVETAEDKAAEATDAAKSAVDEATDDKK